MVANVLLFPNASKHGEYDFSWHWLDPLNATEEENEKLAAEMPAI